MNIYRILDNIIGGACAIILLCGCNKQWLDAKPNINLVVPTTMEDYQAILDNDNTIFNIELPGMGEICSGDFSISDAGWSSLATNQEKYAYMWDASIYRGEVNAVDWNSPYRAVFTSNLVLEGTTRFGNGSSGWNNVEGSALFFRSLSFYCVAQVFAPPYNKSTAGEKPGIPLRLKSDVNEKSVRASLQSTYEQIINDLLRAKTLLPQAGKYKTRPSKAAALGLLARVYLSMGEYEQAYANADSCLSLYNSLMDYSGLNPAAARPFPLMNEEVIFQAIIANYGIFSAPSMNVDAALYNAYQANDLRKTLFFAVRGGNVNYKGSYYQAKPLFGGIATDEILLIRSECAVRQGKVAQALSDLNRLLEKRWANGTYQTITETNPEQLLKIILSERRKELCFRGLRWSDLRRLNTDSRFAVTLKRTIKGQTFSLVPSGAGYVLPIPDDVIALSGIPQNAR